MIYSYLIVLRIPTESTESFEAQILPGIWLKLDDFLSTKTNLNKFYNIYKFAQGDNIDPITVNYYTELDKFVIHPGYNRLYALMFAKQEFVKAYLFSSIPIQDIPNIDSYLHSWEPVVDDLPAVYSTSNGLPGHLEYQTAKQDIHYHVGFYHMWVLERKGTPMFQIGAQGGAVHIINYNESISLYKNLKFFMKRVEFNKDDFIKVYHQLKL